MDFIKFHEKAFIKYITLLGDHKLMGLLNHLFGTTESIAREIASENVSIRKIWEEYHETIPKKKALVGELKKDNKFEENLKKIKELVLLELTDISYEEKKESELLQDIEAMEYTQEIKRVHRLQECLEYAETRYEYAYELLRKLHAALKTQIHLVENLLRAPKEPEKLISHLKLQVELETEIIMKIEKIEKFDNLFRSLVRGEHIVRVMNERERELYKKMQKGVAEIFSGEITQGVTYEWATAVFESIEDKFRELEAQKILVLHPNADFELVNRKEFVTLVREIIQDLKGRRVSEQMITVFVQLFREWYNYGRD